MTHTKKIFILSAFFLLHFSSELAYSQLTLPANMPDTSKNNFIAGSELLVCGGTKVFIIRHTNTADSLTDIVWEWDSRNAAGKPPEFDDSCFQQIDECKMSKDGSRILITSSTTGGAAIIERSTHRILFWVAVPNAHSIEALPGGLVAVAASTHKNGNCLLLFDSNSAASWLYRDSLYSAHGLLWDQPSNALYVLGYSELRRYRLNDQKKNTIGLTREKTWKIPGAGGHDLQRGPSPFQLILTDEKGVFLFNTRTESFTSYNFIPTSQNIKSISFHPSSHQLIYTQASESWWTDRVRLKFPDKVYIFPDIHVYKARWGVGGDRKSN